MRLRTAVALASSFSLALASYACSDGTNPSQLPVYVPFDGSTEDVSLPPPDTGPAPDSPSSPDTGPKLDAGPDATTDAGDAASHDAGDAAASDAHEDAHDAAHD